MSTSTDPSTAEESMGNAQATFYLSQLIGKSLRIHTSDKRVFGGQMKCTDKDRNVILALTYEYREPSAEVIAQAVRASGNPSVPVQWTSRYVGLVVVPGAHITKIELEDTSYGNAANIARSQQHGQVGAR
jgi:small nuclear ribonucleoprotein (snRNP)-like protein